MTYMSLCVVMTDWGNLRDEIFSRTGFAPSVARVPHCHTYLSSSAEANTRHSSTDKVDSNVLGFVSALSASHIPQGAAPGRCRRPPALRALELLPPGHRRRWRLRYAL